jgi:hypothetical protein
MLQQSQQVAQQLSHGMQGQGNSLCQPQQQLQQPQQGHDCTAVRICFKYMHALMTWLMQAPFSDGCHML